MRCAKANHRHFPHFVNEVTREEWAAQIWDKGRSPSEDLVAKDMSSVLAGEDILRAILAPDLSHTEAEPYILSI